jgi:argininosuccinate lyase
MTNRKKPWGGRFQMPTDTEAEVFTSSIHFDQRLYRHDIEGSIAHAQMLAAQKLISRKEEKAIVNGLKGIMKDVKGGRFGFATDDEDIHMAIEKELIRRIGDAGGKLHTARSRNDQVSLDMRLYLRDETDQILGLLKNFKSSLVQLAKNEIRTIMPGYTHLQKAQPVLLSHWLLAYWEMVDRDDARLRDCRKRVDILPLGAAALAGTNLPIDRQYVAGLLNFPVVSENTMDTVSDRDFVAEFIFTAAMIMMHLSRFCEDLILWSSGEFGFVEISDAFTTGSSIMPQKKNPDVAELVRGKTGRVYGHLVALLTILKGLPMTYNRDLQEDKEPLFDTIDTVKGCLQVLTSMSRHLKFNHVRMREEAGKGFSTATDLAEYLVMKGLPFREAHGIVGRLVAYGLRENKTFAEMTLKEFKRFSPAFEADALNCLSVENAVHAKTSHGGTAEKMVLKRIADIEGRSDG